MKETFELADLDLIGGAVNRQLKDRYFFFGATRSSPEGKRVGLEWRSDAPSVVSKALLEKSEEVARKRWPPKTK